MFFQLLQEAMFHLYPEMLSLQVHLEPRVSTLVRQPTPLECDSEEQQHARYHGFQIRLFGAKYHSESGTVPTTITCVINLGSPTTFVSYDGPSHSSIVQNNSPNTGSVRSQIFGIALSSADVKSAARISGSACEQSQWTSNSIPMGRVPGGIAKWAGLPRIVALQHFVVLTVAERDSSVSEFFTYSAPSLSAPLLTNGPEIWRYSACDWQCFCHKFC